MTCEFLSGLTKLPFPAASITTGVGSLPISTLYLFLSARNRAGWTVASDPVTVNIAANTGVTVNFPPAARGIGTNFLRYSLSAGTTNDPIQSRQIAEWENYFPDGLTTRVLAPIALTLPAHILLAPTIATPANLPTGTGLINGMHRLISGGLPGNAAASYYKYSAYESRPVNAERIIEPIPGEKWVRVLSPYTGQFTDPYGVGGCAADVRSIDPNYIILPPAYDPNQPNPVKGVPIALTWRNNSSLPLKAGTNFGLEFRQGAENRTDAFNGKAIVTLKGFADGLGGLDKSDGGVGFLPWVDIDRVWSYGDDALGILTLDKDLPAGSSVVYEIAPYFTAQQFQGNLASGETISTYLYPYSQAGKNVAALASVTGDLVLPVGNRLHVLPKIGASVQIDRGSAIVKGYVFSEVGEQTVFGLTPNTANQKIVLDGNGVCTRRAAPLGSEVILAIVSTESGSGRIGTISLPLTIAANGSATLVLNYTGFANGKLAIDPRYPIIGGDLADFNVPFVDLYAVRGGIVYPALVSGTNRVAIVPSATATVAIDSLGASIAAPANPVDPLFDLFPPPIIAGVAGSSGSIAAGSYQFFAIYYYNGTTASKIDRTSPTVIRESTLSLADLYLLNQGWGRPIYNLADLRSIARSDTFGWQQRPVQGGSIFYYDPDSSAVDDGIAVFKPNYLANQAETGRWVIRRSFSITPKGAYSSTANYSYLELVTANGGSYLYINPGASTGQPLSNSSYWLQITEKGSKGDIGNTGAAGSPLNPRGTYSPSPSATYAKYDQVDLAGSSYYWANNTPGNTAPPGADWQLVSSIGLTGAAGTTGTTTVGSNPNIPAGGASATYTVASTTGIAVGQYYGFSGVAGTLLCTAIPTSTTVTLQNINAIAGSPIASSTKLVATGEKGNTGAAGSPLNPRGTYSASATYAKYDQVNLAGSSYYWANNTAGNNSPPGVDWQLVSSQGLPGVGDMNKSIYDIDNNGIVDDAAKLASNLPGYYLDRANHTNTQAAATITDFSEAVDDRVAALLVAGANITIVYNDPTNTLTVNSSGGLTAWQLKTADYTAVNGDRIRALVTTTNLTILCPANPTVGAEFEFQRLDTTSNSLIIDPNGKPFKSQANKDGLFNNGNIGLSERISYVDSTIGWLPQHDRLTYQTHVNNARILLQLNFEGANNSTIFTDSSSFNRSISSSGNAKLTTTSPLSGLSSGIFDGSGSYLTIPTDLAFNFGDGNFSIRGKLKTSQSAAYKAVISRRSSAGFTSGNWLIYNNSGSIEVWLGDFSSSTFMLKSTINVSDGISHTFDWRRIGNIWTLSIDGNISATITSNLIVATSVLNIIVARDITSPIYDYAGLIDDLIVETL
jgi:hypothetical protein